MRTSYKYELTGQVFGKLTVIGRADFKKNRKRPWECRCECGATTHPQTSDLIAGKSTACRKCAIKKHGATKHGGARTPTYGTWLMMRNRCSNPKFNGYARYGGRGISVCKRWDSYENFLVDMGERPKGKTLDRIENEGNYSPDNCRWATRKQQARNTCSNRLLTYKGKTKTIVEWAEIHNIDYWLFRNRLNAKLSFEEIISTPRGKRRSYS